MAVRRQGQIHGNTTELKPQNCWTSHDTGAPGGDTGGTGQNTGALGEGSGDTHQITSALAQEGQYREKDSQAGGKLDLADLNLVQKRNHILKAAIAALSPQSRELLSIVAILSAAVDYSTLSALLSDRPLPELRGAITDLENRGLRQYDAQARRYDLQPVVRGVANGGLRSTETECYGISLLPSSSIWKPMPRCSSC